MQIPETGNISPEDKPLSLEEEKELKRKLITTSFENLFENKIVYHERFTCIARLEDIELLPDRFSAKVVPLHLIEKGNKLDGLFPQKPWEFGSSWDIVRYNNNCLMGYGSWLVWCDPETVKEAERLTLERDFKGALNLTLKR